LEKGVSKERELLKKILKDTAYIDYSFNDNIRNEILNFLAQPEQESPEYEDGPEFEGWEKRSGVNEYVRGYSDAADDLKREPMSENVINILKDRCIRESHKSLEDNIVIFVRALEKHHGIEK
jgi:hypothetical protein